MPNWQPIETAPKDGTPILLWDNCMKCPVVAEYSFSMWYIHESYGFNEDGQVPTGDVTHWMPLPEPPDA